MFDSIIIIKKKAIFIKKKNYLEQIKFLTREKHYYYLNNKINVIV